LLKVGGSGGYSGGNSGGNSSEDDSDNSYGYIDDDVIVIID
jgi:hypothetical protein